MSLFEIINLILGVLFVMCYAFQFAYLVIPFIKKLPPHKETTPHKYAILIAARNEERVIKNLLDSIKSQDYPKELVTTFVVADNCTDKTAEVCRECGAVVYERENKIEKGKGYALNYALGKIDEDFGKGAFDAFIIFDADNILTKNYITEINKTFSDGYEVVTSYRNTKNFSDGWLSGGAAIWYLRESKYLNGSRMRIGACPQVSGTGFLFSESIKEEFGGWPFHTLTEDYEFTCHSVIKGKKFGYCEEAMFYDEQTSGFAQSWNQRMRWVKGGLQGFVKYWRSLLRGIFSRKFVACYDMLMSIAPAFLISLFACIINAVGVVITAVTGGPIAETLISCAMMVVGAYLILLIQSVVTVMTEWKKIRAGSYKKILYMFAFPFFIITFIPICFVALFKRVEWKPVIHNPTVNAEELCGVADKENK